MERIYLNKANINREDIKSVKQALNTNWVATYGNQLFQSEKEIKKITNAKYVCLLNSGTSSLHLALKSYKFKKKSEVLVPSLTFISPVNSIIYCDLKPIFMDVNDDHNVNIKLLLNFLKTNTFRKNKKTYNKKTKKQIVAIIIVHMWGNISNMISIKTICRKYNIKVIEDAAEALGSFLKIKNKKVHAGTFGDIGCLSFNGNKIVTGGNGGAIITNNQNTYKTVSHLAAQAKKDNIAFIHDDVGYNYKMSNLNASLLYSQLKKLKFFIKKKNYIRGIYFKGLKKSKFFSLVSHDNYKLNNNWLNILKLNNKKIKPRKLNKFLEGKNIETRMVWHPNHDQTMFKNYQKYKVTKSLQIPKYCLCLPSGTGLKLKEIKKVISSLIEYEKKI